MYMHCVERGSAMKGIFDWVRGQTKTRKKYANERYEDMMRINAITIAEYERGKTEASDCVLAMLDEAENMWEKDCCEWKYSEEHIGYVEPSCTSELLISAFDAKDFKFCPYCGRKIVEVE